MNLLESLNNEQQSALTMFCIGWMNYLNFFSDIKDNVPLFMFAACVWVFGIFLWMARSTRGLSNIVEDTIAVLLGFGVLIAGIFMKVVWPVLEAVFS